MPVHFPIDRAMLGFALRTTCAALAGLLVAASLGLPNPYWAAMTVWIVAQPTRGMLLERSLYRLIGTAIGAAAGFAILHLVHDPALVIVALALWAGLCAATGNLLRHLRAYGALLAGYTAAIVVLPDFVPFLQQPDLSLARVACTLIGVVASTLITLAFTPPAPRLALIDRMQRTVADAVDWAALALCDTAEEDVATAERRLANELAEIDDQADQMAAGSPEAQRRIRHVRGLISAVLSLMTATRTARLYAIRSAATAWRLSFTTDLVDAAAAVRNGQRIAIAPLRDIIATAPLAPALTQALDALVSALALVEADRVGLGDMPSGRSGHWFIPHRDWRGARMAALRATLAVLVVGGAWLATGWHFGPYTVMSVTIFACVLSTHDRPTAALRLVLTGASIGAVAGLLCHLVLLPLAGSDMAVALIIAPFLLAGGAALAHPKTAKAALDANMVFLLVSQPMLPLHGTTFQAFEGAAALLLGMAMALLAYRVLLPVDPTRRLDDLSRAIARDLDRLATTQSATQRHHLWARLHHRALRLVLRARDSADISARARTVDSALAVMSLGQALLTLRLHPAHRELSPRAHDVLKGAVFQMRDMSQSPGKASQRLRLAANALVEMAR